MRWEMSTSGQKMGLRCGLLRQRRIPCSELTTWLEELRFKVWLALERAV